jgi:hypothetical protein
MKNHLSTLAPTLMILFFVAVGAPNANAQIKNVPSIVELKATALDQGIPGVSPTHMLLFVLLMFSVPMISYLFLYLSLRDQPGGQSRSSPILEFIAKPFRKMIAWVHTHRHLELLHH